MSSGLKSVTSEPRMHPSLQPLPQAQVTKFAFPILADAHEIQRTMYRITLKHVQKYSPAFTTATVALSVECTQLSLRNSDRAKKSSLKLDEVVPDLRQSRKSHKVFHDTFGQVAVFARQAEDLAKCLRASRTSMPRVGGDQVFVLEVESVEAYKEARFQKGTETFTNSAASLRDNMKKSLELFDAEMVVLEKTARNLEAYEKSKWTLGYWLPSNVDVEQTSKDSESGGGELVVIEHSSSSSRSSTTSSSAGARSKKVNVSFSEESEEEPAKDVSKRGRKSSAPIATRTSTPALPINTSSSSSSSSSASSSTTSTELSPVSSSSMSESTSSLQPPLASSSSMSESTPSLPLPPLVQKHQPLLKSSSGSNVSQVDQESVNGMLDGLTGESETEETTKPKDKPVDRKPITSLTSLSSTASTTRPKLQAPSSRAAIPPPQKFKEKGAR